MAVPLEHGECVFGEFLVGIVERERYRPIAIRDIRVVRTGLTASKRDWSLSLADPLALQRYRQAQEAAAAVRFPGPLDRFDMRAAAGQVRVQETRSAADWVLAPVETPDAQAGEVEAGQTPPGRSGRG